MKMLFYSSDVSEVELARGEFANVGIPCEVRCPPPFKGDTHPEPCAELWIHRDKDCSRAFLLCVQLGIGFSRRHHQRNLLEEADEESRQGELESNVIDFEPRSRRKVQAA